MAGGVEVFARVLVWAGIAASNVAARQAHAQVRPRALPEQIAALAFAGGQRVGLRWGLRVGDQVFARIGDRRRAGIAPA
jgi:hypothetical protein